MNKYRIEVFAWKGQGLPELIDGEAFEANNDAEARRKYRQYDVPPMGQVRLFKYDPPKNLVFGKVYPGGWGELERRQGVEEFP